VWSLFVRKGEPIHYAKHCFCWCLGRWHSTARCCFGCNNRILCGQWIIVKRAWFAGQSRSGQIRSGLIALISTIDVVTDSLNWLYFRAIPVLVCQLSCCFLHARVYLVQCGGKITVPFPNSSRKNTKNFTSLKLLHIQWDRLSGYWLIVSWRRHNFCETCVVWITSVAKDEKLCLRWGLY